MAKAKRKKTWLLPGFLKFFLLKQNHTVTRPDIAVRRRRLIKALSATVWVFVKRLNLTSKNIWFNLPRNVTTFLNFDNPPNGIFSAYTFLSLK